ncbi:MAG: peptide chain release factor N(5)-glutamine methyltransferase [Akkermansia sp.]|nr:peptide chain release factor N(5)-glutamine methyltransferase [Akkermansia sp.]
MNTIQEVLQSGTKWLEARGVDAPRYSMQSLMVHVLGRDKTWLYLHYEDALTEPQLEQLRHLLRERGKGVPLQHLLGETEFFRRSFRSDARALVPRPETEELVEMALQMVPRREGLRVLDMGCGSGVIGITLALELAALRPDVVLADISEAALSLALENATALGARVRTYRSDLFSAWTPAPENAVIPPDDFDLVLANLPYVPEGENVSAEVRHDPATALYGGADGLDIVRRFVVDLLPHASPGALVLLEVGHDQGQAVCDLMRAAGYERTQVLTDMSGKARFPIGYAPQVAPSAADDATHEG